MSQQLDLGIANDMVVLPGSDSFFDDSDIAIPNIDVQEQDPIPVVNIGSGGDNGIQEIDIVGSSPSPKPPEKGSPGATSPIMPRSPPPFSMFTILSLKKQVPLSTKTILLLKVPLGNASQPSRLPPAPSPYCTGPVITVRRGADQGWNIAGYVPSML